MAKPLGVHAAVPLRLSMLLTRPEFKVLEPVVDAFDPTTANVIATLERTVRESHRIVKGVAVDGTFEYRRPGSGTEDDEVENVDAVAFCQSEFPALFAEAGNVLMEGDAPVEFLMTSRFTVALMSASRRRGGEANGSRLMARRGIMEVSFFLYGQKATSIADAILAAEAVHESARRWLEPVATEIAECNMLSA